MIGQSWKIRWDPFNFRTVWWLDIQVILFVLNNNSTYPGFAFHCLLVSKIDQRLNSIWMNLSPKRYNLGRMTWETKWSVDFWNGWQVGLHPGLPQPAKRILLKFFGGGRIIILKTFSTCYHTIGMAMLKSLANISNRLPTPQTCHQQRTNCLQHPLPTPKKAYYAKYRLEI